MNKKAIRAAALLSVVLCTMAFCSCGKPGDPVTWRNEGFCAKIEYTVRGFSYAARVSAGAADGDGSREYSLLYTAPETLSGIAVKVRDGEAFLLCGTLTVPVSAKAGEHMCAVVKMLSARGLEVERSEKSSYNGIPCIKAELSGEGRRAVFYLSPESGLPVYAQTQDGELEITVKISEMRIGAGRE